jgi:hypothetical protein
MGTRHLTKVIDSEGITRVAQYGQWDGYPDYTGTRILDFIKEYKMLDKIEKSLFKARFITDEEAETYSKPFTSNDGWMNMEQGDSFSAMYPSLTRDTGCDIIKVLVYSNGDVPIVDNSDFENDDIMCEGVYTLNYQTQTYTTKWGGFEQSFTFNELPTAENYLNAFKTEMVA